MAIYPKESYGITKNPSKIQRILARIIDNPSGAQSGSKLLPASELTAPSILIFIDNHSISKDRFHPILKFISFFFQSQKSHFQILLRILLWFFSILQDRFVDTGLSLLFQDPAGSFLGQNGIFLLSSVTCVAWHDVTWKVKHRLPSAIWQRCNGNC